MNENKHIIVCDDCKYEFLFNAIKIKEASIELNGVNVILVYFTCPNCDKIYRISIQDARYYDLVKDLEKTKKRIRKNQGSHNFELARVLNNMVEKKSQRLKEHVRRIDAMFPGTFTFVTSENNDKEKIIKYLPL